MVSERWVRKQALYTGRARFPLATIEVRVLYLFSWLWAIFSYRSFTDPVAPDFFAFVTGFHGQASKTGNLTPKTLNSLSAIAGHEGDEEDWEREMRGLRNEDEVGAKFHLPQIHTHRHPLSILSPCQSSFIVYYHLIFLPFKLIYGFLAATRHREHRAPPASTSNRHTFSGF